MLRVGEALEEAVGGAKRREAHFRAINERRKALVVALARFAEEHSLDRASGVQSFFDQASALHSDEAGFRRQAAAKRHAKLPQPAIIAAGEQRRFARGATTSRGFTRRSHSLEVSKLSERDANCSALHAFCDDLERVVVQIVQSLVTDGLHALAPGVS